MVSVAAARIGRSPGFARPTSSRGVRGRLAEWPSGPSPGARRRAARRRAGSCHAASRQPRRRAPGAGAPAGSKSAGARSPSLGWQVVLHSPSIMASVVPLLHTEQRPAPRSSGSAGPRRSRRTEPGSAPGRCRHRRGASRARCHRSQPRRVSTMVSVVPSADPLADEQPLRAGVDGEAAPTGAQGDGVGDPAAGSCDDRRRRPPRRARPARATTIVRRPGGRLAVARAVRQRDELGRSGGRDAGCRECGGHQDAPRGRAETRRRVHERRPSMRALPPAGCPGGGGGAGEYRAGRLRATYAWRPARSASR